MAHGQAVLGPCRRRSCGSDDGGPARPGTPVRPVLPLRPLSGAPSLVRTRWQDPDVPGQRRRHPLRRPRRRPAARPGPAVQPRHLRSWKRNSVRLRIHSFAKRSRRPVLRYWADFRPRSAVPSTSGSRSSRTNRTSPASRPSLRSLASVVLRNFGDRAPQSLLVALVTVADIDDVRGVRAGGGRLEEALALLEVVELPRGEPAGPQQLPGVRLRPGRSTAPWTSETPKPMARPWPSGPRSKGRKPAGAPDSSPMTATRARGRTRPTARANSGSMNGWAGAAGPGPELPPALDVPRAQDPRA